MLKKLYKIALALIFLGLMFKVAYFPGASIILVIGSFLLTMNFIISQKTIGKHKVLGLVFRISFAFSILGGIFYIMHWPGSYMLRYISAGSMIIAFVLSLVYKDKLLKTTKNITLTLVILGFLLQFSFFRFAFSTLSFNYPIYLEKMEIDKIRTKITEPIDLGYVNAKTKPELDSLKYYMNINDKIINKIHPHELLEYCFIILENQSDTSVLNHGLKWSNWIIKKDKHYAINYFLKIKFLIKLKEYNSALNQLEILEKTKFDDSDDEKRIRNEINELKKICSKNLPLVK